ncbi:flagellar basal-body MS-ring/collar protein FliF [Alkalilacustris brevis]|uniref:flagellar basal-body MS-ring/collar protein FliF n=1 Tax=Alkalilacustris brevis TaxID=2026338 RepID=UPI000E0D7D71|nr:flagellar basal-body MS-ring/collar protein FliF [Alkalilacustris brevis]
MQQLFSLWSALEPPRRLAVGGATLIVLLAVLALGRMAAQPNMALLYAGLEGAAAGEVVEVLEQRGIRYEVRGDSIFIPVGERDRLRMTLATHGLPANGAVGYELLDGLSGFGTTSQMFDAAYWRAKEGELARTITASPQVRAARVHIGQVAGQPFRREIAPTASVTLTPVAGALSPGLARGVQHMVAAAVPGLQPPDVAVIDGHSGTVLSGQEGEAIPTAGGDREERLKRAVERLLEAHVGPGRARVEVSVETVNERETIVERRLDPDSRVALTSDTEERSSNSSGDGGGGVTVASNLPDGDAGVGAGQRHSQNSETRMRQTFDVSQVERELHRQPGAIRKLTVAAIIDGVYRPDEDGVVQWTPRPEDEIEAMRELVASAVGFDAGRGDVITIRSLRFEQPDDPGGSMAPGGAAGLDLDVMSLVQLAVLGIVTLALILFVIRPMLAQAKSAQGRPAPAPGALPELPAREEGAAPAGPTPGAAPFPDAAPLPAIANFGLGEGLDGNSGPGRMNEDDPVARLNRLIEDRQDETIEILRSWMEEGEEETA